MLTKIAWRNIWRNLGRSLISISAVFFCVFFAILLRSMQTGSYENITDDLVGGFSGYIQIHQNGFWDEQIMDNSMEDKDSIIQVVTQIKGVDRIVKRLESFSLVSSGTTTNGLVIMGIDPDNELSGLDLRNRLVEGQMFENGGIVIGQGVAEYFKKGVGDTLILIGQGYHGQSANGLYHIAGVVKMRNPDMNKSMAFLSLKDAQVLFAAENRVTSYVIEPGEGENHLRIAKDIIKSLPETYEALTYEEMMPELIQALQADSVGGLVMLFVLYMIIGFVLLGTVIMMTAERTREFGILVSVGMHKSKLIWTTVMENAFLAILGGLGGMLAARPIQWYYHNNPVVLSGNMEEAMLEYGYEPIMPLSVEWSLSLWHTGIIITIAFLVSIYAVVKIAMLKPVEAMRT